MILLTKQPNSRPSTKKLHPSILPLVFYSAPRTSIIKPPGFSMTLHRCRLSLLSLRPCLRPWVSFPRKTPTHPMVLIQQQWHPPLPCRGGSEDRLAKAIGRSNESRCALAIGIGQISGFLWTPVLLRIRRFFGTHSNYACFRTHPFYALIGVYEDFPGNIPGLIGVKFRDSRMYAIYPLHKEFNSWSAVTYH